MPNAEFVSFEHPRFGLVPCILATHDIQEGEEIFVHYGYDLQGTLLFVQFNFYLINNVVSWAGFPKYYKIVLSFLLC